MRKSVVFGGGGMLGSALVRELKTDFYPSSGSVNLEKPGEVKEYFEEVIREIVAYPEDFSNQVDVYMAAGDVGGIQYNIDEGMNLFHRNYSMIYNFIMEVPWARSTIFFSSSCVYPRNATQPFHPKLLKNRLDVIGGLEPSNAYYALAKFFGHELAARSNIKTVIPCNLFGPGDKFNEKSHFLAAIVKNIVDAHLNGLKEVVIWGDGEQKRELLHVDDCASAAILIADKYKEPEAINVGYGIEYSIKRYAGHIAECVGYKGKLVFDTSKPVGMRNKLVDSRKIRHLGWEPKVEIFDGIRIFASDYLGSQLRL